MNIDEPGEEQVIDEDFHGEVDENLFQDLVTDDVLDPNTNFNYPNIVGGSQGAGHKVHKEWWLLTPWETYQTFWWENWITSHLDAFDDDLEIQQINVFDSNVAQIITRFINNCFLRGI